MPLLARFGVTATCRASLALYNTREEVDGLARALTKAQEYFRMTKMMRSNVAINDASNEASNAPRPAADKQAADHPAQEAGRGRTPEAPLAPSADPGGAARLPGTEIARLTDDIIAALKTV